MNKYRVDRADRGVTPCGMNSILYIGDNSRQALLVFRNATTGKDAWNQPNPEYGVILSEWSDKHNEYRVTGMRPHDSDLVIPCIHRN